MKLTLLVAFLTFVAIASAEWGKPEPANCKEAADVFVKDYNEKAGDPHVQELDKVIKCAAYLVPSKEPYRLDVVLGLDLTMKTREGHYKSCFDVAVMSADDPTEVTSYGTCRK